MASLRPLAPRASLALHSKQLQQRLVFSAPRYASTTPPPKPRLLEKPERFNPPSHPSRIRAKPKYYGPDLSEHERQQQKVRRYPHMMPPEGSFMFWFLTDRNLHLYITLSILVSLVLGIYYQDFIHTTPYRDLLPPNSMLFAHPITFFSRWVEVWKMHVAYTSAQTAERRRRNVEDVQKRSEYRKAHGLEDASDESKTGGLFGGWTARGEGEAMGPAIREGGVTPVSGSEPSPAVSMEVMQGAVQAVDAAEDGTYVDFEGKTQPLKKKWFGIW